MAIKSLAKTRKVGGSLVITIPVEVVKDEMLEKDELVEVEVKKRKKDFFGALKGIGGFREKDRLRERV